MGFDFQLVQPRKKHEPRRRIALQRGLFMSLNSRKALFQAVFGHRKSPPQFYQNYGGFMVEVRRVELLSKSRLTRLSTSVVNVLGFPSHNAHQQALCYGSL